MTYRVALVVLLVLEGMAAARDRSARGSCAGAHVSVENEEQRIVLHFSNHCEQEVHCSVDWSVRCGKQTATAKTDHLRVDAGGESQFEVSARHCGDDAWRILPPRWRCDAPSAPVEERNAPPIRRRR